MMFALALMAAVMSLATTALQAQSTGNQQSQTPPNAQSQEIPDAPSAVQPPAPKPELQPPPPGVNPEKPANDSSSQQNPDQQAPPQMAPVQTIAPGTGPRNQINPTEDLYKISVGVNFVLLPVMVKDADGRRVDGLLPKDFTVLENGKPQTLTYFTSDPFQLSVAIVLDTGMADVSLQKISETYSALIGAFSPYDEVALYTYSSTVSQATDFSQSTQRLSAVLADMKLNVHGHNNGPAVLGGPLGPQGPMVNGMPVGTNGPPPVYTPPRESHVLNDAILRAALDLSKRDKTRRKVIFVISDGRELGSRASYSEVLKLLQTRDIQVKAVTIDTGALPVYRQIEKLRIKGQGYSNVLPKYCHATGSGNDLPEMSRNAIEDAYTQITSEARNQYTLGYVPKAVKGSAAYRNIEIVVHHKGLNVYAKDGYYPVAGR